jgi:hypothetical protein
MMKKLFLIYALMSLHLLSSAQDSTFPWLKKDTKIRYYLTNYGRDYEFIVNVQEFKPDLQFNWWMTRPADRAGIVIITENAMEKATQEQNYFSGGTDYMDDRTTVWVSRMVYDSLKQGNGIVIQPLNGDERINFVANYQYKTKLDGKELSFNALYAEGESGHKYWILDSRENPLILKMVLDFNIEIGEIMTNDYWEN